MNYSSRVIKTILFAAGILMGGCDKNDPDARGVNPEITLKNFSATPSFVAPMAGFESVKFYSLISSEDKLAGSPAFVYGAQPDGAGLMKDPNSDGYIMITNHEILFSVSRVYLDKTLTPIRGEYIVDAKGGGMRLCSATLATPEVHGFGPVFLTAGETSQESMVLAINPLGLVSDRQRNDRTLPALGKANMENAVPLPKVAYPGKTVILIGEDQSYTTAHASAGQFVMYMSGVVGDLQTGELYALKRSNGNQVETDMTKGNMYDVEFVKLPNIKSKTGAEINTIVNGLGAIRFSRVEDVDYRKGSAANNREVYFTATGQSPNASTPEPGYTMWGRIYKLVMDAADPTKGKLELVAEGDSKPGADLINPDNLCVTENFVYIQEDGDSYYPAAQHDSYIWQLDIATKVYKPFITMNHKRDDATWNTRFNTVSETRKGSWEYGAMVDISDIVGIPNTFTLNIHAHTWQKTEFGNADGSGLTTNKEGGETIILSGVPK